MFYAWFFDNCFASWGKSQTFTEKASTNTQALAFYAVQRLRFARTINNWRILRELRYSKERIEDNE